MVKISVGARVASVGSYHRAVHTDYWLDMVFFFLDITEDKFVLDFLCNVKNGCEYLGPLELKILGIEFERLGKDFCYVGTPW